MAGKMKLEHAVIVLGIMLILMASLPVWKMLLPIEIIAVLDVLLVAAFYLFFFKRAKKLLGKEFTRYFAFFTLWLVIVQLAVFSVLFFNPLEVGVELFVVIVAALIALSLFFRLFLGKNEVEGRVLLSDSGSAAVELNFDLFAGLNSGKYVVSADKKYNKGEKVRVALKRKFFKKIPKSVVGEARK